MPRRLLLPSSALTTRSERMRLISGREPEAEKAARPKPSVRRSRAAERVEKRKADEKKAARKLRRKQFLRAALQCRYAEGSSSSDFYGP